MGNSDSFMCILNGTTAQHLGQILSYFPLALARFKDFLWCINWNVFDIKC
jgi:hypothetical protein